MEFGWVNLFGAGIVAIMLVVIALLMVLCIGFTAANYIYVQPAYADESLQDAGMGSVNASGEEKVLPEDAGSETETEAS